MTMSHNETDKSKSTKHERRLTVREIADVYQVHQETVRRWVADGCPAVSIGGGWRFLADDVESWLRVRTTDRRIRA